MSDRVLERVVRRESHSSRSVSSAIVLVLVALVLAWIATEVVLRAFDLPALLVTPGAALTWVAELPGAAPTAPVIAGAAGVALVGIIAVLLAVSPGRLAKQRLAGDGPVVLVDNGALASAVAQGVCSDLSFDRREVSVGVGHRVVDVTVRPAFGVEVETSMVKASAERELASTELDRELRVRVYVVTPKRKETP